MGNEPQHNYQLGQMHVESIADHMDLIDTIAQWQWADWGQSYPDWSPTSWAAHLRKFTLRDRIPTTYVAFDRDELLGSVALVEHDIMTRQDLTPWVSNVYIKRSRRGQGVGGALVQHAVDKASEMGIRQLYVYTRTDTTHPVRKFYTKFGWRHFEDDRHEGWPISILTINTDF